MEVQAPAKPGISQETQETLDAFTSRGYDAGFVTDIASDSAPSESSSFG